MPKAIALLSGGLDSTLAILTVLRQGIDVTAITFLNNFGCNIGDKSSCSKDPFSASIKFGFKVKLAIPFKQTECTINTVFVLHNKIIALFYLLFNPEG